MKSEINRRQFVGAFVGCAAALYTGERPLRQDSPVTSGAPTTLKGTRPFVVDVHVHMSDPATQAQRATSTNLLFKPFQAQYDGDGNRLPNPKKYSYFPEQIIQRMNEGEIDVSFVMVGGGTRTRRGRPASYDYLADQIKKYPDRLVGMPIYDPLQEQWRGPEFVDYIAKLGMKAIKLLPVSGGYNPYDERLWPLYVRAMERDITMTFHTGWSPFPDAAIKWAHEELDGLDQVGIRYPELKVHLAHAGGPSRWADAVLVTAKHDNFSLDFSSWCTYPPQQLIAMLALARDVGGIEKVMFASEHSVCDPGMFVREILNINLWADALHYSRFTDEDIRNILGLNAARRWKLSTTPRI